MTIYIGFSVNTNIMDLQLITFRFALEAQGGLWMIPTAVYFRGSENIFGFAQRHGRQPYVVKTFNDTSGA